MTRTSDQQYNKGNLWNGFDYDLQVWVEKGTILNCGHPMKINENVPIGLGGLEYTCNCNARIHAGRSLAEVKAKTKEIGFVPKF